MENNHQEEQILFEEQIDEEEKNIFYKKITPSLEDTLISINIYGDEDDK